jgi:hypothetical protein
VLGDDAFFPVSAEYARFRLHRALGRTERSRVSGLSSLPSVLEGGSGPVEHPARALSGTRLSRIVNPDEERKLFTLPEIGGMTLPEEEVGEFRRQVADARESRLVLRNMTPEERVQEILSRFYRLYFIRERLEDLSTRLLDTALALHRRGMHHYTKLLVDYADSLLQPGPAMERHPLLNFLVYKTFLAPRT